MLRILSITGARPLCRHGCLGNRSPIRELLPQTKKKTEASGKTCRIQNASSAQAALSVTNLACWLGDYVVTRPMRMSSSCGQSDF